MSDAKVRARPRLRPQRWCTSKSAAAIADELSKCAGCAGARVGAGGDQRNFGSVCRCSANRSPTTERAHALHARSTTLRLESWRLHAEPALAGHGHMEWNEVPHHALPCRPCCMRGTCHTPPPCGAAPNHQ
eukprot:364943-Chlamydomonas_euryale.AAC.8